MKGSQRSRGGGTSTERRKKKTCFGTGSGKNLDKKKKKNEIIHQPVGFTRGKTSKGGHSGRNARLMQWRGWIRTPREPAE